MAAAANELEDIFPPEAADPPFCTVAEVSPNELARSGLVNVAAKRCMLKLVRDEGSTEPGRDNEREGNYEFVEPHFTPNEASPKGPREVVTVYKVTVYDETLFVAKCRRSQLCKGEVTTEGFLATGIVSSPGQCIDWNWGNVTNTSKRRTWGWTYSPALVACEALKTDFPVLMDGKTDNAVDEIHAPRWAIFDDDTGFPKELRMQWIVSEVSITLEKARERLLLRKHAVDIMGVTADTKVNRNPAVSQTATRLADMMGRHAWWISCCIHKLDNDPRRRSAEDKLPRFNLKIAEKVIDDEGTTTTVKRHFHVLVEPRVSGGAWVAGAGLFQLPDSLIGTEHKAHQKKTFCSVVKIYEK